MSRLLYRDFVVNPDRLPTLAGSGNAQLRAYVAQSGGSPITDMSADLAGQVALSSLRADSSGSWAVYLPDNLTPDGVLWFEVVGSTAGRYALGPASGAATSAIAVANAYTDALAASLPNSYAPIGAVGLGYDGGVDY